MPLIYLSPSTSLRSLSLPYVPKHWKLPSIAQHYAGQHRVPPHVQATLLLLASTAARDSCALHHGRGGFCCSGSWRCRGIASPSSSFTLPGGGFVAIRQKFHARNTDVVLPASLQCCILLSCVVGGVEKGLDGGRLRGGGVGSGASETGGQSPTSLT